MGFVETLQIVFITLKILGLINWSWWIVFLPFEIVFGVAIIVSIAEIFED